MEKLKTMPCSFLRLNLLLGFVALLMGCATPSAAPAVMAVKTKDLVCPPGPAEGERPLDAMAVSRKDAILICGHREDIRGSKRMRASDFAVYRVHFDVTNTFEKIVEFADVDVRYVQLNPIKREVEIIDPVFSADQKPIPVFRDVFDCQGEKCVSRPTQCVFKKDEKYLNEIKNKKSLNKWLVADDRERRATQLFLASASGDNKAAKVFKDQSIDLLKSDGHFSKVMENFNKNLTKMKEICNHQ